jgi:quinol monooxygenase YgiN
MIYLNVILTVKNGDDVAEIQSLLSEQGRLSRMEPGCIRFEVYHSQANPQVFLLNEHWTDQAAVDAHRKAAAYTTIYQPKVLPKVDRVPHPSSLIES